MDPRTTTVERALALLSIPDLNDAQEDALIGYLTRERGPALYFILQQNGVETVFPIMHEIAIWLALSFRKLAADKAQLLAARDAL